VNLGTCLYFPSILLATLLASGHKPHKGVCFLLLVCIPLNYII
jgi:hypothetical protein